MINANSESDQELMDTLSAFPTMDQQMVMDTIDQTTVLWARLQETLLLPNGFEVLCRDRAACMQDYRSVFEDRHHLKFGICIHDGDVVVDQRSDAGLLGLWIHHHCRDPQYWALREDRESTDLVQTNMALYGLNGTVRSRTRWTQLLVDHEVDRLDLLALSGAAYRELDQLDDAHWPKLKQLIVEDANGENEFSQLQALLEKRGFHVSLAHGRLYALHRSRAEASEAYLKRIDERSFLHPIARDRGAVEEWLRQRLNGARDLQLVLVNQWPLDASGAIDREALPLPPALSSPTNLSGLWAREMGLDLICLKPVHDSIL